MRTMVKTHFGMKMEKNADAVSKLFPVAKITIHVKFTRIRLSACGRRRRSSSLLFHILGHSLRPVGRLVDFDVFRL